MRGCADPDGPLVSRSCHCSVRLVHRGTMTADLAYLSIAEAAALIARKALSPVTLTDALLARIDEIDGQLGSFVTLTPETARVAARNAEDEIMRGQSRGPLHGIPIALKDAYDTAGIVTTVGSKLRAGHVPLHDAMAWARLKDAGAILLGKLETTEFCYGGPSADGLFPPSRNPWNLDCYAGGSSSGAGVALAAGLCLGALGTDTGGSIRLPAAYCGVTGLMTSTGLISRAGVFPLSYSFDHLGPMARSAEDCAILLEALAAHDPNDPNSVSVSATPYRARLADGIKGMRIGVVRAFSDSQFVTATIAAAMEDSARILAGLGATVAEAALPELQDFAACQIAITLAEGFAIHEDDLRERRADYSYYSRVRLSLGPLVRGADYVQAQRLRRELIEQCDAAFEKFDLLLLPGAPGPAPEARQVGPFDFLRKPLVTIPANVLGAPAIAMPAGFTDDGLPLSIQLMGRRFDEAGVLRAAYAFQQETNWHQRRPSLFGR